MSKIQAELEEATGVKKGRGASDQDHYKNLVDKVTDLNDDEWGSLSKPAQAWFNEAVDALNDNKDAPAFPDAGETKTTRRGAAKTEPDAPAPWIPQAGDVVVVTTKRGKVYEGEFMELDGDVAVVKVDGEEMEFTADRTESMMPAGGAPETGSDELITDGSNVEVDDTVTVTTKRNAVITGVVVEITDDVIVLEVDGKEAEYDRSRVATIVVDSGDPEGPEEDTPSDPVVGDYIKAVTKRNKEVEGKVVEIEESILVVDMDGVDVEVDMNTAKSVEVVKDTKPTAPARGKREAAPEAPARGRRGVEPEEKEEKKTKTTKADNGGVSVGLRMRQVICENPDAKVEEINKLLTKEGLSFKEATLKIVYKDVQVVFELLKKLKHWK